MEKLTWSESAFMEQMCKECCKAETVLLESGRRL